MEKARPNRRPGQLSYRFSGYLSGGVLGFWVTRKCSAWTSVAIYEPAYLVVTEPL